MLASAAAFRMLKPDDVTGRGPARLAGCFRNAATEVSELIRFAQDGEFRLDVRTVLDQKRRAAMLLFGDRIIVGLLGSCHRARQVQCHAGADAELAADRLCVFAGYARR